MLGKLFLLSVFFPFISPFPINTDVQPICGMLALLVCVQAYINNKLSVPLKFVVVICFVMFFAAYNNVFDPHLDFKISKHLALVFGIFTLLAFYKTYHLLDRRLIYFVVLVYFSYTCFTIATPDFAVYMQNFIVRNTNSTELGYRGVSTLATEPGLLGGLLVFFLFVIYELFQSAKISKGDLFLLSALVLFVLLMTKSGTGYLYLIIFVMFLIFEIMGFYRAVMAFLICIIPLVIYFYVTFGQFIDLESNELGRGVEILLMLSDPLESASADNSIMTRVVQLYLGFVSIGQYPLGVGSASVEYYAQQVMESDPFIRDFYARTNKDFGTNSSFSYMTVAYGIFFWMFLLYLYFVFSKSSVSHKFFSFIYLAVSYSAAFPPIWVLLLLKESRVNEKCDALVSMEVKAFKDVKC